MSSFIILRNVLRPQLRLPRPASGNPSGHSTNTGIIDMRASLALVSTPIIPSRKPWRTLTHTIPSRSSRESELGTNWCGSRFTRRSSRNVGPEEPAGYRSAGTYIDGAYVSGAAQLLAMLLSSPDPDPASLMLLAKTVMPNGNSAFLQKPDVPTYLVGSHDALIDFGRLVPAPNETYTSLFWLGDTSSVDDYLQKRKKEEDEAKIEGVLSVGLRRIAACPISREKCASPDYDKRRCARSAGGG